jgi:AcrR family transcriptional regulator
VGSQSDCLRNKVADNRTEVRFAMLTIMATSPIELPSAGQTSLPMLDGTPCERADAARNRRRILAAAARLIDEQGAEHVSMEAIAEAAGVGKGTLFRRFGDRVGLMQSLLDARERELQESAIRGEPPLGPGAPPVERIVAFGRSLLAHLDANGEILSAAESGGRFNAHVYVFYRTHLLALIREAAPEADADYLADVLLAPLGAHFHLYMRRARGLPLDRVEAGYEDLVRRVLSGAEGDR